VERLMRDMGLAGAVRGKRFKTTIPDESASRPADLANRGFGATGPNQTRVAGLSYNVAMRGDCRIISVQRRP
jgi:putative transposase